MCAAEYVSAIKGHTWGNSRAIVLDPPSLPLQGVPKGWHYLLSLLMWGTQ